MPLQSLKLGLASTCLALIGCANAQNAAVVNGTPLESKMLDFIMSAQEEQGVPNTPETRKIVRENLIQQEVLRQEAASKGLTDNKEHEIKLYLMESRLLADSLREDFYDHVELTEEEMQANYQEVIEKFGGDEYNSSHILVKEEENAKKLITQLNEGADFAALAKENSIDTGSGANGGELGWASPRSFVPEFSEAMVALEKGKYSTEPVKSQFGYHIILLNDTRPVTPPPFEQVKPQLRENMLAQKWEEYVQKLQDEAKIK